MFRTAFIFLAGLLLAAAVFLGCSGEPGEREFRGGVRELEQGRNVRALALLEKSISRRPASAENAVAHNYIGVAAWRLGQIPRAVEAFENSRRLNPELVEPAYNLAALYFEAGDADRATPLFEEVARLAPQDPRPLEFIGRMHFAQGRLPEARRALFGALARAPQSPRVLTAMALLDRAGGDSGRAIFYLMQALERDPAYAPALFNLGVLYRDDLKDPAQAMAYFGRCVEANADETHRAQARAALEALSAKPAAAPAIAEQPASRPVARPAAAPEQPAPQPKAADDFLKDAKAEAAKGNTVGALNICLAAADAAAREQNAKQQEKALRLGTELGFDQARAHHALGRFLAAKGDTAGALKAFKQAVLLDGTLAAAQADLAAIALKAGEQDTALVSMRQAVQLEPGNAESLWSLAMLYDETLGMPARAVETYREFAKRFPGDARVVRAQSRLNELAPPPARAPGAQPASQPVAPPVAVTPPPAAAPEAAALPRAVVTPPSGERRLKIRKPLIRNSQSAVQAYNRGTLYQQREDWDRAIFFYTRALENDDTFTTAYFNLGAAYWAKGDHELAKDAYRLAIETQPEASAARFNLALLHRELRERDAAIRELNALLETTPDYAQAHYVLGLLHAETPPDIESAKQHYQKFLELTPADPAASIVREWLKTH